MKNILHFLLIISNIFLYAQNGVNHNWSQAVEVPKNNIGFNSVNEANNNMVILEDGSIFLIYTESNESEKINLMYYVTSDDGENWTSPELFEPGNLIIGSCCPNIAVDKNNTIHIVWHSKLLKTMYYCNYKDGIFTDALQVNKAVKYDFSEKYITVDQKNRVHIFWQTGKPGTKEISEVYYNRSLDNGNSFESAILLSENDGFHSAFPKADFSGNDGDILAVAWVDSSGYTNNTNWDILSAVSLDGGESWETKPICTSIHREWNPGITVDKNGNFILNYQQSPIENRNDISVLTSTSSDGGENWTIPSKVTLEDIKSQSTIFNYDYRNNIHWIFWKKERFSNSENPKTDIVAAYSLDAGSNWSDPEFITEYGDSKIELKNAWIGNDGTVSINYEVIDSSSEYFSIYYQKRTPIQFIKSYQSKNNKDESNWASAYPNPASSEVTITFKCKSAGEYEVGIFNLLGEKKVSQTKYFETGIGQLNFKLSGFLPGIYFYTVVGNGKVVTGKLTKVVF